ncbi:DUF6221 family protein [Nonomuraea wenchangensis]|uniref:DUF6221 family protein n=1 Tax=Nonomuraea wenchangensis TaxID=568860 RepID=UPI0033172699
MMSELVDFYEARLGEDQAWAEGCQGHRWVWECTEDDKVAEPNPVEEESLADGDRVALRSVEQRTVDYASWTLSATTPISYAEEVRSVAAGHIVRHDPARVLADVAADRKLIARYKAAEESHEEALRALTDARQSGADEAAVHAAGEDLAAAHARAAAYLTILEDRAARFFDHPDFQPHWRQP